MTRLLNRAALPPVTLDDLMELTGKSRRNMQEIVRQYTAITGREVMRFPKRNYLELRFTPEQRDEIVTVVKRAEEEGYSYADLFQELITGKEASPPLMVTRADWTDLQDRLSRMDTKLEALAAASEGLSTLYGKLDARIERLQASLDASSGVAGGLLEQPQGATKKRKTSARSERTTRARPEGERA